MPEQPVRLQYLWRQYTAGNCSREEFQELYDIVAQARNEELSGQLDQEYQAIRQQGSIPDVDWDGMFNRILEQAPVTRKVKSIHIQWWRYAAAIALLLGLAGGIYFMAGRKPAAPGGIVAGLQRPEKDLMPAHAGAVLTLANGTQVVLDSTADGSLGEQGGTSISKVNGQLVYAAGTAPATEVLYNTIATSKGRYFRVVLPDGTKVWLDALSSLKYPSAFTGNSRTVELTGEGYFEVKRDEEKPFLVMVNGNRVEVLGTSFNINAYTSVTITTLIEGAVNVKNNRDQQALLRPGQQAQMGDNGITVQKADIEKTIAWKEGEFRFRGDDMTSIMNQLSRWYDLEVQYEGRVPAMRYSGSIGRDAKLSEVLEMLRTLTGARFDVKGKTLKVSF